jgi:tetratricopeptide (TPR) repeat protein
MQFHQAFYQKHGIKVTRDAINRDKNPEQTRLEMSLLKAIQSNLVNHNTVHAVEQAVQKYPDSEALKNYLYSAYTKTNQPQKAFDCLLTTVKQHPNYAFGVINLVNYYLRQGNIAQAEQYINEPYDVHRVEKEEFIHDSVFMSYYQAVVRLALAKRDQKTAEKYHRLMFEYNANDKVVREISDEILKGRFENMQSSIVPLLRRTVEATPKAIKGWEKSTDKPVFIHSEVQQLFRHESENMPKKIINELLALPRETLIQDLENVLADMVRRRDMYLSLEDWDEETMSFPVHAVYLLTELRAYERLPIILNILRQDEVFLDHWFSDGLNDYFLPTIYLLGNNQVALLKAFVLEPNNFYWSRGLATEAISQIALRQPERRAEVVQFFKDIAQAHLDQPANDGLIDNNFLGSLLNDILNFKGIELEQEIIALFQKGWISDGECGSLEDVLEELRAPEDKSLGRAISLPVTIFEMYSGQHSDKIEYVNKEDALVDGLEDPYNMYLGDRMFSDLSKSITGRNAFDSYPQETVRREEPKLGRNDPCHCGSGKKYKKCHGA